MDLITPAYQLASTLAQRLPKRVVEGGAPWVAGLFALRPTPKRQIVERHQQRVTPGLHGVALRHRVRDVYRSYGRYYAESFRLPGTTEDELDDRFRVEGYEHFAAALEGDIGTIAVLPHLGSWEWMAQWLARVREVPVTAVVERLEPPALFEWFTEFRREMGLHIVPLGPEAGKAVSQALKARHVIALLSDRDITGGGVEVEFFGERTTLPAGPATLALRTGATLLPVAMYDEPGGGHLAVVKPPLPVERKGSFREDVTRLTQDIAEVLEDLIRADPSQWHLLQPNWPSDRTPVRL
ncbi:MAG TPA: phosphatidylinositol mannoside acyltransferase [Acidimicrobiales bacterium]|nr:phosphatidylinositol mannoside acyltransferase [Acidimicrobiales bacterium]